MYKWDVLDLETGERTPVPGEHSNELGASNAAVDAGVADGRAYVVLRDKQERDIMLLDLEFKVRQQRNSVLRGLSIVREFVQMGIEIDDVWVTDERVKVVVSDAHAHACICRLLERRWEGRKFRMWANVIPPDELGGMAVYNVHYTTEDKLQKLPVSAQYKFRVDSLDDVPDHLREELEGFKIATREQLQTVKSNGR